MVATIFSFGDDDSPSPDDVVAFRLDVDLSEPLVRLYNPLLTAEVSTKGAGVRASIRVALTHPVGLALLGMSVALAAALWLAPALRPWSDRAVWVLVLGVAAYAAIVVVAYWPRAASSSPQMRTLLKIRQGIASLLAERQRQPKDRQNPVLIGTLKDAIRCLDDQLIPVLGELLERWAAVQETLHQYDRGELPSPDEEGLERLRAISARQQAAIDECVQQAANAYAALVALLQRGDDSSVGDRARDWANGLLTLYDALDEVLRGADEPEQPADAPDDVPVQEVLFAQEDPQVQDDVLVQETAKSETTAAEQQPNVEVEPVAEPSAATPHQDDEPGEEPASLAQQALEPLVEQALEQLRAPARLAGCELTTHLPLTIAAARAEQRNGHVGGSTPLEQAHVLREVLVTAIERLKPPDQNGRSIDLIHAVIEARYVAGMQIPRISTRFAISDRTVHRYRKRGVEALASELEQQEELLRKRQSAGSTD
ncbi:MAG: hypothetical protein U0893_24940 [Chloroflexota bacterium]